MSNQYSALCLNSCLDLIVFIAPSANIPTHFTLSVRALKPGSMVDAKFAAGDIKKESLTLPRPIFHIVGQRLKAVQLRFEALLLPLYDQFSNGDMCCLRIRCR